MSKVGCNSSPILTWKIISNCEVLCYNECFSDHGICLANIGRLECLILSNQRFSALGMNMHVKSLGRSMALPACSAAVVRGFPLSSYGFVSVPARNALAWLGPTPTRRARRGNSPSSWGPLLAGSQPPKRGRLLACETAKACRELSGARIQGHFTLPTEKNAVLWVKNATELTGNSRFRYRKDRVL